jgi:hypothetical protein
VAAEHLKDISIKSPDIASKNSKRWPHMLKRTPFPNTSKLNSKNARYVLAAIEKIIMRGKEAVSLLRGIGSVI